jgi:hypothetical protein
MIKEMITPTEKRLISFDEIGYNDAKQKKEKKDLKLTQLLAEARRIAPIKDSQVEAFRISPLVTLKEAISKKHESKNELGLSADKLIELLGIDISAFLSILTEYSRIRDVQNNLSPEDFKTYATKPDQIRRLDAVNKLIESIYEVSKHRHIGMMQMAAYGFPGILRAEWSNTLHPDPNFIING